MEQQLKNIEQYPTYFDDEFKKIVSENPELEDQLIKINNTSEHNYNPWGIWMSSVAFKKDFTTNDSVIGDIMWTDTMVETIMSHAGIWEGSIWDNNMVATFISKTGGKDALKRWVCKESTVLPALAYCRCRIGSLDEDGLYPTVLSHAAKECGIKPTKEIMNLVKSWSTDFENSEIELYDICLYQGKVKVLLQDHFLQDIDSFPAIWVSIIDTITDIYDINYFIMFIRKRIIEKLAESDIEVSSEFYI